MPLLAGASLMLVASAGFGGCGGGGGGSGSTSSTSSTGGSGSSTSSSGGGGTQPPEWHIDPIDAEFVQTEFATHYTVTMTPDTTTAPKSLIVTWTLALQLVDPAGAPDPTTPGSGAAVDTACTNAGVGTSAPVQDTVPLAEPTSTDTFRWTHPDPANSTPPGTYGCNHAYQGPSGHQGLVTATVSDGVWTCTATYKGTNTSGPNSVASGTASEPSCTHP